MLWDAFLDFSWSDFVHAFVSSLTVIIVSEIGDKTFFIAAIMAMRHSRLTVFFSTVSALVIMTVVSVVFGWLVSAVPHSIVYYTSTALFALFGLKMLWEGWRMPTTAADQEMDRVQADLCQRDNEGSEFNGIFPTISNDGQSCLPDDGGLRNNLAAPCDHNCKVVADSQLDCDPEVTISRRHQIKEWSRVFMKCFSMISLSEWGDRSQITVVALAAKEDVYGVMAGGALGHTLCTGLAVLGGRLLAQRISVRTVTLIGGVVFLGFAAYAIIFRADA